MSDDAFERYTLFLDTVVDTERVWTLADERDNPVIGATCARSSLLARRGDSGARRRRLRSDRG
jgi:hypothetical protein